MRQIVAALTAIVALAVVSTAVRAAEPIHRTVGEYEISVRYAQEPPYLEAENTLVIDVRNAKTGIPVEGLEKTLRVGGQVLTRDIDIAPRNFAVYFIADHEVAGRYRGVFVAPYFGDYRFRIVGTIEGTNVDEIFASGEGGLADVEVAPRDPMNPGVLITLGILGAYLLGMAAFGVYKLRERRRSRSAAASAGA